MAIKKIFKAVITLTIFTILTKILGFAFRIYLSRELTPVNLGIYQIASSVFGIFLAIVSSGLPLTISKRTAEFDVAKDKQKEHRFMMASLVIGLTISVLCCLMIIIFKKPLTLFLQSSQIYTLLIILIPAIIFSSIYSIFRGNMWGHKNYFWVCFIELIEQVFRILICFILFSRISDAVGRTNATALSLSLACIISGIIAFLVYFVKGGRLKRDKSEYKNILKTSVPITVMRIIQSLVQPLITIVIPLRLIASGMPQAIALSEIGIIMGMTFPLLFIPSAIVGSLAVALIPEISAHNFQGNNEEIKKHITSSLTVSLICAFLLIPIYMGIGEAIGSFVYNNNQSGIYLSLSAYLMIPICMNTIASSILNSLGLEAKSFKNYVVGSLLMIACIWFLPKYIGVYALSIGMGMCLISCTILNIKLIEKQLKCKLQVAKPLLQLILFNVFLIYLTKFTFQILIRFLPMFFSIAFACIICVVAFVILLDIFNIMKIFNTFVSFKRRIFTKNKNKKPA